MTDIEEALALIAAPCTDKLFFTKALKALALVTRCRWAAFGRLSSKPGYGEIIAFCDGDKSMPGFEFKLAGTPCEQMYTAGAIQHHVLYTDNLQVHFPNFKLIKTLGAQSYQAELILDDNGAPLGHLFVLDCLPQTANVKANEFFRLLAQRIGVEYSRHTVVKELLRNTEMIASSKQFMSFVDTNYCYQVVSKGYESLFGLSNAEIIGQHVASLHGQAVFESKIKPLLDRSFEGQELIDQIWIHPPKMDKPIYINVHHNPYYDAQGVITGSIISAHNITEIQQAKDRIEYLANHDSLTGLANRRNLFAQMEQRLEQTKNVCFSVGIIYLDLNNFKQINDSFGHNLGDVVLKKVAELLKVATMQTDTIARMGGDEFIIVTSLECVDNKAEALHALKVYSEKINNILDRHVVTKKHSIKISASVGTHLVTDPNTKVSTLINQADHDMFKAKKNIV
ncbi:diguanylate cyclase domain-containing protein [Shewanella youngdeokensis]|uniref:Diguanylate cyclase n=1 Tax=Shewanella youngdeokensis TaxID=2999068 RepID=A0ABZ0K1Y9_9GAMM|nr:diguanylate cyclase [Shewanella sp. DAU334]